MPAPVPPGTRLLHIGPPKTGTTSLQSAFHNCREALAVYGVHYAGKDSQPWGAATDALRLSPLVDKPLRGLWAGLAAEVREARAERVVVSSEVFAHADDHAADAVLDELGRDRTHVVITMRPLADMLSSSWAQYVQSGAKIAYDAWLEGVLDGDGSVTPSFWRRTRIDVLAERWGSRVGPERLTVVSLGARPREYVLRAFEQLLALPEGLLVPKEGEGNVTLPYAVQELARQFNAVARELGRGGTPAELHEHRTTALEMAKLHADRLTAVRPVQTPAWAVERACAIAAEMNDRIRALGVHVAGDLDALARPGRPVPAEVPPPPTEIPIGDAAALAYFMMRGTHQRTLDRFEARERRLVAPEEIGGRQLLRLLGVRVRRRLGRR